jgi:hypothetical protein
VEKTTKESTKMTTIPPEVADELRARAFGTIRAYLRDDEEGALAIMGDDAEAAVLLPVLLGILVDTVCALLGEGSQIVGRELLEQQVNAWLDERRARLFGA